MAATPVDHNGTSPPQGDDAALEEVRKMLHDPSLPLEEKQVLLQEAMSSGKVTWVPGRYKPKVREPEVVSDEEDYEMEFVEDGDVYDERGNGEQNHCDSNHQSNGQDKFVEDFGADAGMECDGFEPEPPNLSGGGGSFQSDFDTSSRDTMVSPMGSPRVDGVSTSTSSRGAGDLMSSPTSSSRTNETTNSTTTSTTSSSSNNQNASTNSSRSGSASDANRVKPGAVRVKPGAVRVRGHRSTTSQDASDEAIKERERARRERKSKSPKRSKTKNRDGSSPRHRSIPKRPPQAPPGEEDNVCQGRTTKRESSALKSSSAVTSPSLSSPRAKLRDKTLTPAQLGVYVPSLDMPSPPPRNRTNADLPPSMGGVSHERRHPTSTDHRSGSHGGHSEAEQKRRTHRPEKSESSISSTRDAIKAVLADSSLTAEERQRKVQQIMSGEISPESLNIPSSSSNSSTQNYDGMEPGPARRTHIPRSHNVPRNRVRSFSPTPPIDEGEDESNSPDVSGSSRLQRTSETPRSLSDDDPRSSLAEQGVTRRSRHSRNQSQDKKARAMLKTKFGEQGKNIDKQGLRISSSTTGADRKSVSSEALPGAVRVKGSKFKTLTRKLEMERQGKL